MKTKTKRFLGIMLGTVMCGAVAFGAAACKPADNDGDKPGPEKETYNITMWVSEVEGVADQFRQQVAAFNAQSNKYTINAEITGMGEGEAATQVLNDVESAPDMYCFAQDQLARLVQAGALAAPGVKASETITNSNDAGAVKAASASGKVQCYPLTSDNGYFMYYDKTVVKQESLTSLEAIIADCENANKSFAYQLEGSGWYSASFFFATGCHSNWTMDEAGKFTAVDDDFNSANGLVALKGMQKVLKSKAYLDSSEAAAFNAAIPAGVLISGTWASKDVKGYLGDNFGVAQLPSFEVDGKSYHLGSFSGNKLMGVKPQTTANAKKGAACQELALYLTNKENQLQRFNSFGWGPSNKDAQNDSTVKADAVLSALAAQNQYGTPQGNIHGSWWDIAKAYATGAKTATSDTDLQKVLDDYKAAIDALFQMSDEEKRAFTVIGSINGDTWSTDLTMVEGPENTWITKDAYDLKGGEEFKCRQGKAWDVAIGNGEGPLSNQGNYKVADGTTGKYKIKLVVTVDGEGKVTGGTIELVAV